MKKVELRIMEQNKYEIIKNLVDNNGNKLRTAKKLNITFRHVNRLIHLYKTQGKAGFIHGNRGRLPKKAISQQTKENIMIRILIILKNCLKNMKILKFLILLFIHYLEMLVFFLQRSNVILSTLKRKKFKSPRKTK